MYVTQVGVAYNVARSGTAVRIPTFRRFKRRTNVQQLTCKIDSSKSFYYLFFSFIILELKPLVLKGKVRGEKL